MKLKKNMKLTNFPEKPGIQHLEEYLFQSLERLIPYLQHIEEELKSNSSDLEYTLELYAEKNSTLLGHIQEFTDRHEIEFQTLQKVFIGFMIENNISREIQLLSKDNQLSYQINFLDILNQLHTDDDTLLQAFENIVISDHPAKRFLIEQLSNNNITHSRAIGLFVIALAKYPSYKNPITPITINENRVQIQDSRILNHYSVANLYTTLQEILNEDLYKIKNPETKNLIDTYISLIQDFSDYSNQNLSKIRKNPNQCQTIALWYLSNPLNNLFSLFTKTTYYQSHFKSVIQKGLKELFKDSVKTNILFNQVCLSQNCPQELTTKILELINTKHFQPHSNRLETLLIFATHITLTNYLAHLICDANLSKKQQVKFYRLIKLLIQPHNHKIHRHLEDILKTHNNIPSLYEYIINYELQQSKLYFPHAHKFREQHPEYSDDIHQALQIGIYMVTEVIRLNIEDLFQEALIASSIQREHLCKILPSQITMELDQSTIDKFTTNHATNIGKIEVTETTRFTEVLSIGHYPHMTCYNYQTGEKKYELLGLLLLEDRKVIKTYQNGIFESRAVLKLISVVCNQNGEEFTAITIDNFYGNNMGFLSITKHAYHKAQLLGLELSICTDLFSSTHSSYAKASLGLFRTHRPAYSLLKEENNQLNLKGGNHMTNQMILVSDPIED